MTKSVFITIPIASKTQPETITPVSDFMSLVESNDSLIYGFHGSPSAKTAMLNDSYMRAQTAREKFFLVDIVYQVPEDFDASVLVGLLAASEMKRVPFLITKRISSESARILGELWFQWAVEAHGERRVNQADVDWSDPMSFIPPYSTLANRMFETFPKLRCAVIPVRVGSARDARVTWVGVSPKAKAHKWVASAEVRMQPEIAVNLKF